MHAASGQGEVDNQDTTDQTASKHTFADQTDVAKLHDTGFAVTHTDAAPIASWLPAVLGAARVEGADLTTAHNGNGGTMQLLQQFRSPTLELLVRHSAPPQVREGFDATGPMCCKGSEADHYRGMLLMMSGPGDGIGCHVDNGGTVASVGHVLNGTSLVYSIPAQHAYILDMLFSLDCDGFDFWAVLDPYNKAIPAYIRELLVRFGVRTTATLLQSGDYYQIGSGVWHHFLKCTSTVSVATDKFPTGGRESPELLNYMSAHGFV